ncbi:MAG: methionine gamma-lyase [Ignavibacteria bacterium GWF2_33_9]|nr:MAG: methionine gamma-lyase [Ignavibacteria bacterium GWF2_33_9]
MKNIRNYSIDTQCIHAGTKDDANGAVITPIYQTSTFKFQDASHGARLFKGEEKGYIYTRLGNPTIETLEDALAIIEGGAKALACASGMAAVHTLLAGTLQSGDHVVCSESVYGATQTILANVMTRFGIETTFVDTSDLAAVRNAVKPSTKMIYVETPANPTIVISDLEEIGKIAKEHNCIYALDNTFMSPVLQRPFDFGVDYSIHSMTKYLNGHADVVAGAIIVKDEGNYSPMRKMLNHFGGTINPFDAFLVHRGLKTLKLRVMAAQDNAQKIAEYLEHHPKVENVMYPGLKSHPQYELAQKQQLGSGSMISMELKGGFDAGVKLMNSIEIMQLAVSLGGVESLIQHPASMTHAGMSPEARLQAKITDGLVRISVGIEDVDELIVAMDKALAGV